MKVKVEKFIDGKCTSSFQIPAFALGMAQRLLPAAALSSLARSGISVDEIMTARKQGKAYSAAVDVEEHGISKRVVVSLR